MTLTDPFSMLSAAKNILHSDRASAVALGQKAVACFKNEQILHRISARNAVLRFGNTETLEAFSREAGAIFWNCFHDFWDQTSLSCVLHADGIRFLDLMLHKGAPPTHLIPAVEIHAKRRNDINLIIWSIQARLGAKHDQDALRLLFHAVSCCPETKASALASCAEDCIHGASESLVSVFQEMAEAIDEKVAAVCVLLRAPPQVIARLCAIDALNAPVKDILKLGLSRHGQIEASRREPDLAILIARQSSKQIMSL